ncbi:MAG TPA: PQQ-binding-like beta-propeller repeat protein, partial [Lacipirellulaceae bacterium]|nr:PQQ-binding-like beta-propeller repeat protein [Lacipirellulaceae bacterium]
MRIEDFIDALTLREVVDAQQADRLRAKIEESQGRATPEAILSYLVKKGVITGQQAEDLEVSLLSVLGGGEPEVLDLMPLPEDQSAARDEPGWALEEEAAELIRPAPAPHLGAAPPPPPRRSTADDEFLAAAAGEGTSAESLGGGSRGPTAGGVYRLGAGKAKKKAKRTAGGKSQWDSPLLLVGGGVLAVLVLSGATLYYLLFRETADAILKDAERLVSAGAYSQAITRYEDFVKRFSSHSDASWARVELEMTRAWQAVDSMGNPADALAVVTQTIERIESQPAFIATAAEGRVSEAKRDLSTLLVRIAEALVERAERTDDQQEVERRVKQIEDVLALSSNDKYVPENLRNVPKLTSIRDSLAVIATRRQRDGDLSDAITAMDAAITAGRPSDAYAARLELLARHPALVEDPRLVEKLREASAAEQRSVVFQALGVAAETQWPQRAVVAELALADRTVVGDGPPGPPVVVRIDGALFGLSSGNGSLLWRRGAGQGDVAPVVALPGNHLAVSDLQQGEVWRLDAATGKLVWRQALDDRVIGLTLAGPRLLAASEGGKLYVIDAEEGRLAGVVAFTQPLRTAA